MPETRLSLTEFRNDGSVHRRSWLIPTDKTEDVAHILTGVYGEPRELLATAEAVEQINDTDVPGVVTL